MPLQRGVIMSFPQGGRCGAQAEKKKTCTGPDILFTTGTTTAAVWIEKAGVSIQLLLFAVLFLTLSRPDHKSWKFESWHGKARGKGFVHKGSLCDSFGGSLSLGWVFAWLEKLNLSKKTSGCAKVKHACCGDIQE
ncbi:hypothetical protein TWF694_004870 [Orbilia ellipsospora]|uniref:Uncharacterized protein n=1 Tax=Orbilia ellipsospora TaxID=2528407 RepID=A0AAV9WTW6_9PEZI